MFKIGKTLVSEEIIETHFHCNVDACKGACCIEGSGGAPLMENEVKIIDKNYKKIAPYLSQEAKNKISKDGKYIYDKEGKMETPLLDGKACVYVHYKSNGLLECGIEKAYNEGQIELKKPLSCHLYPIRIKEYSSFTAVNYHKWGICSEACSFGENHKKPLFQFVKEALIKRFGDDWFIELEKVAKELKK